MMKSFFVEGLRFISMSCMLVTTLCSGVSNKSFLLELVNREVGLETETSIATFAGLAKGYAAFINKHKLLSVSIFDYLTKSFTDTISLRSEDGEFACLPKLCWGESDDGKKYLVVAGEKETTLYLFNTQKKTLVAVTSIPADVPVVDVSMNNIQGKLFLALAYGGKAPSNLYRLNDQESFELVANVSVVKNLANRLVSYAEENHSSILLKEEDGVGYLVVASSEKDEPVRIVTFDADKDAVDLKEIAHTKRVDGVYADKPGNMSKDVVWSLDLFRGPDRKLYLVTGGGLADKRVSPTKIYRLDQQEKNKTSLVLVAEAEPIVLADMSCIAIKESVRVITVGTSVYVAVGHDGGGCASGDVVSHSSLMLYEFGYGDSGNLVKITSSDNVESIAGDWRSYAADSITGLSWLQQPAAPGNITLLTGMRETDVSSSAGGIPASSRSFRLVNAHLLLKTYVDDAAGIFSLLLDRQEYGKTVELFGDIMQERMPYALDILQELPLQAAELLVTKSRENKQNAQFSLEAWQMVDRLMEERKSYVRGQKLQSAFARSGQARSEDSLIKKFARSQSCSTAQMESPSFICDPYACYSVDDCLNDPVVLQLITFVIQIMTASVQQSFSYPLPEQLAASLFMFLQARLQVVGSLGSTSNDFNVSDAVYSIDQLACFFALLFNASERLSTFFSAQGSSDFASTGLGAVLAFPLLDYLESIAPNMLSSFIKLLCAQREDQTFYGGCGLFVTETVDYASILTPIDLAAQLLLTIGLFDRHNVGACCDQFPKALRIMFDGLDACSCSFTCLISVFVRVLELLEFDTLCKSKNTFCTALICLGKRYDVMAAIFDQAISQDLMTCPFDLLLQIAQQNSKDALKIIARMADEYGCDSSLKLIQELWSDGIVYI